jgi:hypothetical protein
MEYSQQDDDFAIVNTTTMHDAFNIVYETRAGRSSATRDRMDVSQVDMSRYGDGLRAGLRGVRLRYQVGATYFALVHTVQSGTGAYTTSTQVVLGALSSGVKATVA